MPIMTYADFDEIYATRSCCEDPNVYQFNRCLHLLHKGNDDKVEPLLSRNYGQLLLDFAACIVNKKEAFIIIDFAGAVPTYQQLVSFLSIFAANENRCKLPKLNIINLPEELPSELTEGTLSTEGALRLHDHLLGKAPPVDCVSCFAWLEVLFAKPEAAHDAAPQ